jgi:fatty-acyl-CoA synthase
MTTFAKLLLNRADDDHIGLLFEDEAYTWAQVVQAASARAALAELAADIRHTDCDLIVTDAGHAALLDGLDTGVDPAGFLPDVRRYGVTYFNYVGRALAYILATSPRPDDAGNTLRVAFGTEASAQDMARFGARFGCRVIEGYGSSEGTISMSKTPDTPSDALGLPPPGMEVAVLDSLTEAECPPARFDAAGALLNPGAAIGEIVGLNVADEFEGYYNNPEAAARRVRGGRYWSGDLGYRDENGFFYFAGRGADWLRVDGENFAAAPVERR